MSRSTAFMAATLLALPSAVSAQQHGIVRDAGTNAPLPGVVVTAVDSAGSQSTRAIANAEGQFTIALPPHAARLHLIRIGFRPRDVDLPARRDSVLQLVMERIPPLLEAMKVSGKELCPGSSERGAAFALWDQARAGLLAAVVAREVNPATATTLVYDRQMSPSDELIRQQHTRTNYGTTTRPFIAAATPSYFAKVGYMSDGGDGGRIFNAPDADVLLDPSFGATHCFHLQRADAAHAGQIGLAFVPAPGRDNLVDVAGVIWIDQTTPQLRSFDFSYTSLEPPAMKMKAGGRLEFQTMPNGVSFIQRWVLRLPVLALAPRNGDSYRPNQTGPVRRQDRDDLGLNAIAEAGGEVLDARWGDGQSWHLPRTALVGDVVQRKSSEPVRHAIVTLAGTTDSVPTDSLGHFEFTVVPGKYTVIVADTLLREFVAERVERRVVTAQRDRETPVRIEVDRVANAVADVCHGQEMRDKTSIIIGHAVAASGDMPEGAHVKADWQAEYLIANGAPLQVNVRTSDSQLDDHSRFVICGVVRERPIHLRLVLAEGNSVVADTSVRVYSEQLTYPVVWRLPAGITAHGGVLAGSVIGPDARPLANVEVGIPQLHRLSTTDSAGQFQLAAIRPGAYALQVRRIGYEPVNDSITIVAGARANRVFALKKVAKALDTVHTIAGSTKYISGNLRAFQERAEKGIGRFVVDSTLRKNENQPLSDVLRALVPGLRIQQRGAESIVMSSRDQRGGKYALLGAGAGARCFASIYLDGILVYDQAAVDDRVPPPNINDYTVRDITGIEYYAGPASVPSQFKASECGTLLLWTREK